MDLSLQVATLLVLAIPIACVSWTITHEELFREPREFCAGRSRQCSRWYSRKFYYMLTCEFCLSLYVTVVFLVITRFQMLFPGWRGYLISGLSLVWIANQYMSLYGRLRLDIKGEKIENEIKEKIAAKANR